MNGQLCRRLSIIQLPSVLQEAISWEFVVYQLAVLLNRRLHVFTQMYADEFLLYSTKTSCNGKIAE